MASRHLLKLVAISVGGGKIVSRVESWDMSMSQTKLVAGKMESWKLPTSIGRQKPGVEMSPSMSLCKAAQCHLHVPQFRVRRPRYATIVAARLTSRSALMLVLGFFHACRLPCQLRTSNFGRMSYRTFDQWDE